ncbi:MAG TPA: DUF6600 domain-containing protein [Bryobacteraceae bacterium]|jgi:hypothetical protein|nr:DUF6600 domain-containing protein [Bryobacteraceae bacterium]
MRKAQFIVMLGISAGLMAQQPGYQQPPYGQPGYPQQPSQQQGPYYPPQQPPYSQQPQQQDAPDQPGQAVARLGVLNGDVSVRRGDSGDWVAAALNAPLMPGDSVSVAAGGRAELQLDNANYLRIGGDTEIRISDLQPGHIQIQMAKGLITYRVLRDSANQAEISTPAVAVHPLRQSAVRIEIAPDGMTRIAVRHGEVEASTPSGGEHVHEGSMMLVRGTSDQPEYQVMAAPIRDSWDGFNDQRDTYLTRSQSNRYLNPDIYGGEDLDAYGNWGNDPQYGPVWTPNVPAGWTPYSDGQWVWEDFYGWTWVDYSPWGWAPFHYGSWYQRAGFGWTWFPGPRYGHYWWHPAMVGFFGFGGGVGVGFGFGNVGWVPLAPYERFHPWYGPGFGPGARFGAGINVSLVHNSNIGNIYRNARVGGVTAVSGADFQRGQFRSHIPVSGAQLQQVSLVRGAVPITPTASNLRFSERNASNAGPRGEISNQRFFSRTNSGGGAVARTPFTQQQAAMRSAFSGSGQAGASALGRVERGPAGENSGWQRFGAPNQTSSSPRPSPARVSGNGWDRFGSPPAAPQRLANPPAGQSYSGSSRGYSGPSRSVQVAPPIVQQRQSAPSYNRGSAPAFRSAPAPQRGGGGGGGHAQGGGRSGRR